MKSAKTHTRKYKELGLGVLKPKYIKKVSHSQEPTLVEEQDSSLLQEFF